MMAVSKRSMDEINENSIGNFEFDIHLNAADSLIISFIYHLLVAIT